MSAIATARGTATGPRFRGKTLGTARLHVANLRGGLLVPLMILGIILAANVVLWAIFAAVQSPSDRADTLQGLEYSGAALYFVAYMVVFGVQAMGITFPFALGWGVTRHQFYVGTMLAILARSVFFGALFTVLSEIESASNGWGLGGRMFTSVYFPTGEWYVRLLGFVAMFTLAMVIGSAIATVWVRWRGTGMLALWGGLLVLAVAIIAIITVSNAWDALWQAIGNLLSLPDGALWALALIPSVVLAGLGYLVLRRAAPRG